MNIRLSTALLAVVISFVTTFCGWAAPSHTARTFSVRDGLPSNSLSSVAEDSNGVIWIGTWNGLTFYDGYRFFTYRSGRRNGSITTNRILQLHPDSHCNVWFITYDHNVNLLDNSTGRFVPLAEVCTQLPDGIADRLSTFTARRAHIAGGTMWLENMDGTELVAVSGLDDADSPYKIDFFDVASEIPSSTRLRAVFSGAGGESWLVGNGGTSIYGTDISLPAPCADVVAVGDESYAVTPDGQLYVYKENKPLQQLSVMSGTNRVKGLHRVDDTRLVAVSDAGYGIYDTRRRSWTNVAVPQGIDTLFVDSSRRLWITTTDKRVALCGTSGNLRMIDFAPSAAGNTSTVFDVPFFFEDEFGTVWIAPRDGRFGYYDPATSRIVNSPVVSPLLKHTALPEAEKYFVDSNNNLWIISAHGLSLVHFSYQNYRNLPLDPNNETRSLAVMSDGHILAGSAKGMIALYGDDGTVKGWLANSPRSATDGRASVSRSAVRFSNKVYTLFEDPSHNLFIGTKGDGLYVVKPGGEYQHYSRAGGPGRNIDCDTIYDFDVDSKGNIWMATYGRGLKLVKPAPDGSYTFESVAESNKTYPDRYGYLYVRRITHTDRGEVVLSTNGGIITFSDNFSDPSAIRFFSTAPRQGDPSSISTTNVMQVLVADGGDNVLVTSMGGEVQRLVGNTLLADDLQFGPLRNHDLVASLSHGNVLSMMQDNNGNYYFVREGDIVSYLPSDDAVVMLGCNILGGEHEFSEAMPVIGKDGCLYFGSVGTVVKVDPSEVAKEPFKPNIIFTGMQFEGDDKEQFILNPLNIELQPDHRNFSLSFSALDYSSPGHIEYAYRFDPDTTWNYLGRSNVLQITNLKPGVSRLYIRSTNGDGTWVDNARYVDILAHPSFWETVWAKILMALIFIGVVLFFVHYYNVYRRNRLMSQMRRREHEFYVNASHSLRTPLSLIGSPVYEVLKHEPLSDSARENLERVRRNAKNMLEVVNSMLKAEFKPSGLFEDSTMQVADDTLTQAYMPARSWLEVRDPEDVEVNKNIKILIVEDNDDLRAFLNDILLSQYNIITAANGLEGLEKAESEQPDFILTDINMPEMDGLTMVKRIKSQKQLCHIPVLVLSAKASLADRMEGLRIGIDDYITKPFSATYLRQRIANIIARQRLLQQNYFEQFGQDMKNKNTSDDVPADTPQQAAETHEPEKPEYRLDAPQIIEADQIMMEKLMKFLEQRIGDENLRIEEMADAVSMGRTVFYGKIKAIVGMSPSDFLRSLRMQRAEELIVKSKMNFSQIAFSVGFSDPKYFTKCFKKETGMTPSEYRQQKTSEK